jgi:dihydrodipicolinate synthase/N-acetylneuraminate lyase
MSEFGFNLSRGVWAAIAIPFLTGGQIDHVIFVETCRRLAAAGVDGIYMLTATANSNSGVSSSHRRAAGHIDGTGSSRVRHGEHWRL